jgi:GNAT superfamily N-acetyltransferase
VGGLIDQEELRRRAIEGIAAEVEAFGSGASGSRLIRRDGLLASVTPSTPERSLFNSVFFTDRGALRNEIDGLGEAYEAAGIRAWTVWVRDDDAETGPWLADRGHVLDADPRAMALELDDLRGEREAPAGIEPRPADAATCAALNDRAYGYGPDGFRGAIGEGTAITWHGAYEGEEAIGCVGAIAVGDDCVVTGVATPPEHRGLGVASWLVWWVLDQARRDGMRTGSLQATKAGAPLYARMGFEDLGYIEMWELRR